MKNGNLLKILCSKWLSDVSDSSSNTVFSSLEMLRQAFMPVSFSCFLFIDLSAFNFNFFNFNFINWKACYIEWKLTWPLETIQFLCLGQTLGLLYQYTLDRYPFALWSTIWSVLYLDSLAPIHAHAVTLLIPCLKKKKVVCFWWDVSFHLKTFVFFPPENWAGKAFFKIYFEAKSAIILSNFNQTWLVFQYTHSLNEILKRWLPSGVILFNFIKKHQLTATVTSFILYKVTTANIRERIPMNRWIPLLACAWWQWEGRTLSGRPTFCLTGRGWWEGGDRIEKRSLSLFQHEHTTESAPAYS